ncbi:unnamed protein product [Urochloa humidicola]
MGDDAAAKKKRPELTGDLARLTEDNVTDILLRLPAKSVLRCRAVCKAWRDITSNPGFLSAHASLQPADVVIYTYQYVSPAPAPSRRRRGGRGHLVDIGLDVVPVSFSDEVGHRRHLLRYPKTQDWLLLASADGALLFKKNEWVYVICNPVTRQWAQLPRLPPPQEQHDRRARTDREFAFYLDISSGEYRLLCRRSLTTTGTWCILSTGGGARAKPRRVDMSAAEAAGITDLVPCLRTTKAPLVALHGRLHWPPQHTAAVADGQAQMVVFDMSSEKFHITAGPPTITGMFMKLFDMEGLLVAADFGTAKHVDLWFLEDYDNKRWELRRRVATPWGSSGYLYGRPMKPNDLLSVAAAADRDGNIMLGNDKGLVVYNVRTSKVKTVDSMVTSRKEVVVSRHVFKESLVQQPGFVAAAQSSINLSLIHF